jgi:hypothetical protein
MKVEHVDLWRYEETREATDCDGRHTSHKEYLDHRDPSDVVYSKADLFAVGAPSVTTLREGSDRDKGYASIGHATEEGGEGWDISWERVSHKDDLDTYLKDVEEDIVSIMDFEVPALYRARVRAQVRHQYPVATGIAVNPADAKGEPWEITAIYSGDRWSPSTIWEGKAAEVPLTVAAVKEISHDLEVIYANQHIEAGSFVQID